jgi:Lrp/AsnC family transcriptional regulator for asnA, asnC and gidA
MYTQSSRPRDNLVPHSRNFPDLDQMDIRLIEELETDVRQTNNDLAVKLGVSNPTITSRVRRLLDDGVISAICLVDPMALGYKFRVAFAIYTQPAQYIDVANRLAANAHVSAVNLTIGRFNVMGWAFFRTSEDLSDFLSNELNSITGVLHVETMLILQNVKFSTKLLTDDKNYLLPESSAKYIDDLDLNIIRELQMDARQNGADIARKLGVYHTKIFRRMRRLIDNHIIRINIFTNPLALGYGRVATIGLKCDLGKIKQVAEAVASYRQVQYIGIYTGRYDILTSVVFRELRELQHFIDVELGSIPVLKDIDVMIVYKPVKLNYQLPL